ncbi:MAG: hypothetical protein ABSD67_21645 [Terracidiphilus sp.]|jgi:hypothetical protein
MTIQPNSNFPLLASDQADVIQIFLELMIERDRAGQAPEVTTNQPVGRRNDSDNSLFPRDPFDLA